MPPPLRRLGSPCPLPCGLLSAGRASPPKRPHSCRGGPVRACVIGELVDSCRQPARLLTGPLSPGTFTACFSSTYRVICKIPIS